MYEPTSTEDICMCGGLAGLSKGPDVVVLLAWCIRVYMRKYQTCQEGESREAFGLSDALLCVVQLILN